MLGASLVSRAATLPLGTGPAFVSSLMLANESQAKSTARNHPAIRPFVPCRNVPPRGAFSSHKEKPMRFFPPSHCRLLWRPPRPWPRPRPITTPSLPPVAMGFTRRGSRPRALRPPPYCPTPMPVPTNRACPTKLSQMAANSPVKAAAPRHFGSPLWPKGTELHAKIRPAWRLIYSGFTFHR